MNKLFQKIIVISLGMVCSLACSITNYYNSPEIPQEILFQDDFSDSSSGWDHININDIVTDYQDGIYRIFVNSENTDAWSNPGLDFENSLIEIEGAKIGGPDDNYFGVICRYQGPGNFYAFIISSDGYYTISKWSNGVPHPISSDNMEYSEVINQ